MKKVMIAALLFSNLALAQNPQEQQTEEQSKKVTTKDAKKTCKEEGKTGPDLIKCMKEKKGENPISKPKE